MPLSASANTRGAFYLKIPWLRSFSQWFSNPSNPSELVLNAFGVRPSNAGVFVSEESALRLAAVYACVRVLSDTIASLPLNVYRRLPNGGKEKAANHWLYPLIHDFPNESTTSFNWRSTLQGHLCTWGNAYCEIEYTRRGAIVGFHILPPGRVQVKQENRVKTYRVTDKNGKQVELPSWKVLHIPGFGYDGVIGYSPIRLARESIGLGMATEEFGSRFFSEGAHPGVVVESPKHLSDEAFKRLHDSLTGSYSGLGKSHKLMLLEDGLKMTPVGIPPEDAQFLETRKFQVQEICRIFRVQPHMIQDLERATFSNIEHQDISFAKHTIRPWLVMWEQELTRQLMPEEDRAAGYFIEFNMDGLLRGDIKSRYEAYAVARQNGWLSANDIRSLENMNPIENGDIYLVPLNMVPADQAGKEGSKDGA